jgi:NCAIR mutase (PurE)-related protein
MRKMLFILSVITAFIACKEVKIVDNNNQFKKGLFEIPAGNGYGKTTIIRIDSLQIEKYTKTVAVPTDSIVKERIENHIDTLYIAWKNNFSYILRMKSPKTSLDKDQIFVKINKVTDSSYSFIARIGYSKFKQSGTIYKVKN